MRRVALALLSIAACGGPRPREPATQPSASTADAGVSFSDAGAGDDAPSLDAIAARGASEAPQMREVMRVKDATQPATLPAADRDACYRAAVGASKPVRARIEDATKIARGDAAPAATSILVPLRGPACAKKGDVLKLVVDAEPGTIARAVVWQAP